MDLFFTIKQKKAVITIEKWWIKHINYDKIFIRKREEKYLRQETFVRMFQKHSKQQCKCKDTQKICTCHGIIDLDQFNDSLYLEKLYTNGKLDTLYNIDRYAIYR